MFVLLVAVALSPFVSAQPTGPSQYWKNQITFLRDPFLSEHTSHRSPNWVKFTILLSDPNTVYFQDTDRYPLHYDFATELLDPFIGMTRAITP